MMKDNLLENSMIKNEMSESNASLEVSDNEILSVAVREKEVLFMVEEIEAIGIIPKFV